ncbi:MAG: SPOR domain-containing protein [Treponema sp.]|jgi:tetratricopeptide (TPR) repeat protein|nr:SPOR domain-containing protein [Treponema sp.]
MRRLFCAAFLLITFLAGAQEQAALLSAEINSIEQKLGNPSLPAAERKGALLAMARLFELSGNIEGAAKAWAEAARAAGADYAALLRGAYCLAALGEFEAADASALAALRGNRSLEPGARCLHGYIEALRTGNTAPLRQLLNDAACRERYPGIYYGLWRIAGDAEARAALLRDFPQSPEALIARDTVEPAPTAFWLLLGAQAAGGDAVPAPPAPVREVPAQNEEATPAGGPLLLQTGLFSREENAKAASERLRASGFTPLMTRRSVNGREYWAVGAAPGEDYNATLLRLKDRGFDAFPVF